MNHPQPNYKSKCETCGVYYQGEHNCGAKPVEETKTSDPVNRPAHYNQGGIETIDAIREALGADGFRAYCLGNVQKYVWRNKHKGGHQDLMKALFYLRMAVGQDPREQA